MRDRAVRASYSIEEWQQCRVIRDEVPGALGACHGGSFQDQYISLSAQVRQERYYSVNQVLGIDIVGIPSWRLTSGRRSIEHRIYLSDRVVREDEIHAG